MKPPRIEKMRLGELSKEIICCTLPTSLFAAFAIFAVHLSRGGLQAVSQLHGVFRKLTYPILNPPKIEKMRLGEPSKEITCCTHATSLLPISRPSRFSRFQYAPFPRAMKTIKIRECSGTQADWPLCPSKESPTIRFANRSS